MAISFNQIANDTFTRANNASLGANWTQLSTVGTLRINSNQAQCTLGGAVNSASAFTQLRDFPYDQFSEIKIGARANNSCLIGPVVRAGFLSLGAFFQCYYCTPVPAGVNYNIYKILPASQGGTSALVSLATTTTAAAVNDLVRLIVYGSNPATLQLNVNGTPVVTSPATVTDSQIAYGYPGLWLQADTNTNVGAVNFISGQVANPPTVNNVGSVPNISAGQITNLGTLSATGQVLQFTIGSISERFGGQLQLVVEGYPPVLNPLWCMECSQDSTQANWFMMPAGTVPTTDPMLGDAPAFYGSVYNITGLGGATFRFGTLQGTFQGNVNVWVMAG